MGWGGERRSHGESAQELAREAGPRGLHRFTGSLVTGAAAGEVHAPPLALSALRGFAHSVQSCAPWGLLASAGRCPPEGAFTWLFR